MLRLEDTSTAFESQVTTSRIRPYDFVDTKRDARSPALLLLQATNGNIHLYIFLTCFGCSAEGDNSDIADISTRSWAGTFHPPSELNA